MLEKDQPVRDGSWTPAEIALINEKLELITTKPTIYLVNLTMKDYLRQKSKYLPLIAKWVTEHGGVPGDIVPFSVEFEEKLYSMKNDVVAQADFLKESKVKSRLDKIITEGFTKLGLQYYFTGLLIIHYLWAIFVLIFLQLARRKLGAGLSKEDA
jgi:obg-like ATPase 1